MATRDVRITGLDHTYRDVAITMGGTGISPESLTGLTIQAEVGQVPTLTLDVLVCDASTVEGQMNVIIPDATHKTLTALGWTPPGEAQG